jgi:hypothetical protein
LKLQQTLILKLRETKILLLPELFAGPLVSHY